MSCTWLSPWLMLSPLLWFRSGRGIGDVNRDGWLICGGKAGDFIKALGMLLYGSIHVIALECNDHGSVARGVGEGFGEVFAIALVDGLAKRNSGECYQVGI